MSGVLSGVLKLRAPEVVFCAALRLLLGASLVLDGTLEPLPLSEHLS